MCIRDSATALVGRLAADGFDVYSNEQVPCNDGGISYGQAAVAAARMTTDRPGSSTPFPASQED